MINLSKEFKIGLVTILSGCILYFGIEYLKGINVFKPENYYHVKYKNVTGLTISSPVTIDGFKVGIVRTMNYDYENPGNVIVEFSIDKELRLPEGSKAIATTDMLGSTSIVLQLNQYVSKNHAVGDEIIGENDNGLMGQLTEELLPQVEQMVPRIDSILQGLNQIVNHSGLQQTFEHVNSMTKELDQTAKSFNRLMGKDIPVIMNNFETISTNFVAVSEDLKQANFEAVVASAQETLDNVKQITEQMNSTDNSLGLLMNSDDLHQSLNTVLGSTDSLLVDLKKNPKRYVHFSLFGRK